jgi:uncharacterized RDD family membrane protein YckC
MTDITNPKLLWVKGILFLLLALIASAILIMETASLKVAALLAITVWAFCRAYYFAFYVIEHYIDPSYRFAGLTSVLTHVFRKSSGKT